MQLSPWVVTVTDIRTTRRYGGSGARVPEVLRTDKLGTITMTTDGDSISLETTKGIIEK